MEENMKHKMGANCNCTHCCQHCKEEKCVNKEQCAMDDCPIDEEHSMENEENNRDNNMEDNSSEEM